MVRIGGKREKGTSEGEAVRQCRARSYAKLGRENRATRQWNVSTLERPQTPTPRQTNARRAQQLKLEGRAASDMTKGGGYCFVIRTLFPHAH